MKKRIRTAFSLVAVLLLLSNQAIEIRGDGWLKSFEEAERRAEETGQPILIHFGAWYCGPCRQMEQNVFSDPSIDRRLQDGLISVKIDITRDEATAQRFGATTVPRDVVIYPDKTYETLGVGSVSRASYHSLLDRIVATGRRMNVVQAPAANPHAQLVVARSSLPTGNRRWGGTRHRSTGDRPAEGKQRRDG